MFMLADVGVYIALLGAGGAALLDAVTANLNITFLSRPQPVDLIAEVKLLRVGRRTAAATVELYSDGSPELVAHATALYSLPPVK
jgi:acyl-coenzyme A thioesterase PaaI-like protein